MFHFFIVLGYEFFSLGLGIQVSDNHPFETWSSNSLKFNTYTENLLRGESQGFGFQFPLFISKSTKFDFKLVQLSKSSNICKRVINFTKGFFSSLLLLPVERLVCDFLMLMVSFLFLKRKKELMCLKLFEWAS